MTKSFIFSSFMYNGEVNVTHAELNTFLDVAEKLKVRGLTNDCEKEKKPNQLRRKNTTNANSVNSTPTKKAKVVGTDSTTMIIFSAYYNLYNISPSRKGSEGQQKLDVRI